MSNSDESAADPLAPAQAAYAAGDFARVRALVQADVARKAPDAEVSRRALELEARIAIDPWIWAVLGVALALFCGIVVAYAR